MSWYQRAWVHMDEVRCQAGPDVDVGKAIDQSYPWSERSGWAYKAWLDARKDFFRQHNIPLRRAKRPTPDLLN